MGYTNIQDIILLNSMLNTITLNSMLKTMLNIEILNSMLKSMLNLILNKKILGIKYQFKYGIKDA